MNKRWLTTLGVIAAVVLAYNADRIVESVGAMKQRQSDAAALEHQWRSEHYTVAIACHNCTKTRYYWQVKGKETMFGVGRSVCGRCGNEVYTLPKLSSIFNMRSEGG